MGPGNLDVVVFLKFLNTPGTEVAPGSNVVRKDFEGYWFSHNNTLCGRVGNIVVAAAYRITKIPTFTATLQQPPREGRVEFLRCLLLQVG